MKIITWLLTIFSASILLTSCSQNTSNDEAKNSSENEMNQIIKEKDTRISELQKEKEELQNSLDDLELDLKYSNKEAGYYKQFINNLIKDYTDKQKNELASDLWKYELKVNGEAVSKDGVVNTRENIIEISLIQRQPPYQILPNDVFLNGKISGQYNEHISDFSENPSETYGSDGTIVTGVHFKFNNIDAGSTITFTITEELKQRLNLKTSQISVTKVE